MAVQFKPFQKPASLPSATRICDAAWRKGRGPRSEERGALPIRLLMIEVVFDPGSGVAGRA